MLVDVKVWERERKIDWRQSSRKETNFVRLHTPLYRRGRGRADWDECGRVVGHGTEMAWIMTLSEYRMTQRGQIGTQGYSQRREISGCYYVTLRVS
jgi:hypothetical protein